MRVHCTNCNVQTSVQKKIITHKRALERNKRDIIHIKLELPNVSEGFEFEENYNWKISDGLLFSCLL